MSEPLLEYLAIPLAKIVVLLAVLLLIVAYLTFFERKVLAYMQVRLGTQPGRDRRAGCSRSPTRSSCWSRRT